MTSPRAVLDGLTRSNIWATRTSSWARPRGHLVLDADSIAAALYWHCARRHQQMKSKDPHPHATGLVNCQEFARLVNQLLDCLRDQLNLRAILVYGGACKWDARKPLLLEGPSGQKTTTTAAECQSSRPAPSSALTVFKQVVGGRTARGGGGGTSPPSAQQLTTHQAFHSSFPTMVKLARDFRCPVLTNEGHFVLMDVRAGFLLFDEFFHAFFLEPADTRQKSEAAGGASNNLSRCPSNASGSRSSSASSSSSSCARTAGSTSPGRARGRGGRSQSRSARSPTYSGKSRPTSASSTTSSSSSQSAGGSARPSAATKPLHLHLHRLFLRQHPGMSHSLSLQLLPFISDEFLARHAASLAQIRVMPRELLASLLSPAPTPSSPNNTRQRHHLAAAQLECALRFLCARTGDILPFLIRGEAARLGPSSRFEQDHEELVREFLVHYEPRKS